MIYTLKVFSSIDSELIYEIISQQEILKVIKNVVIRKA